MVLLQSGSNTSSGGGGIQMLVSIETHITCDFPGGGGGSRPPIPSLDPHMGFAWRHCLLTDGLSNLNKNENTTQRRLNGNKL